MSPETVKPSENSVLEQNRLKAISRLDAALRNPQETILREHQISMLADYRDLLAGGDTAGYMEVVTAGGKTGAALTLAKILGLKTINFSPTVQIAKQEFEEGKKFTPDLHISNYFSGSHDTSGTVVNTTYQSAQSALLRTAKRKVAPKKSEEFVDPKDVELVIADEQHLGLGRERHQLYEKFSNALFIGMTATGAFNALDRYIEEGIVDENERWVGMFRNNFHTLGLEESFTRNIIAKAHIHMLWTNTQVDEVQMNKLTGEYNRVDLERFLLTQTRDALVIGMLTGLDKIPTEVELPDAQLQELARLHELIKGKQTAIFGLNIAHIEHLAKLINEKGTKAAVVHSRMHPTDRDNVFKAHLKGELPVLLGVDMLQVGWNSPATEVGIFMTPHGSKALAVQEFGRLLRKSPETGKERAIAIQLVDEFKAKRQAPVLLPHIFDPNFLLQQSVPAKSTTDRTQPGEKVEEPAVSFSGLKVDFVMQQIRVEEARKIRLVNQTVEQMYANIQAAISEEYQKNDNPRTRRKLGAFEMAQIIEQRLPDKTPISVQLALRRTLIVPKDEIEKEIAKKVFMLVNIRSVLSLVQQYTFTDTTEDNKDEYVGAAIAEVLENINPIVRSKNQIASQIHNYSRKGVAKYESEHRDMPVSWIINSNYKVLHDAMRYINTHQAKLSSEQITAIATSVAEQTGISIKSLDTYFRNKTRVKPYNEDIDAIQASELDLDSEENSQKVLASAVMDTLESLNPREQEVLKMRYGLLDGVEYTLEEVGKYLNITRERVRQIEGKGLRALRHPVRSSKLK